MSRRIALCLVGLAGATATVLAASGGPVSATPTAAAPQVPSKVRRYLPHLPGGTIKGPVPQHYAPYSDPAGDPCAFPIRGTFTRSDVVGYEYHDASGRLVAEYYRGPLYMKVTNRSTGKSVTVNISGSGVQDFGKNGSSVLYGFGPFSSTQHPGDRPASELTVLHGFTALAIAADGHKTIRYSSRIENVCAELG